MVNLRLISKFVTSQPEKKTIALHIFPNISKSKDNQTMKFGQLIEYNRDNFPENSYIKRERETIPRLFYKNNKIEHISGSMV